MKKTIIRIIALITLVFITIFTIIIGILLDLSNVISSITAFMGLFIGYLLTGYESAKTKDTTIEIYKQQVVDFLKAVKKNNAHESLRILENIKEFIKALGFRITWEYREAGRYVFMRDNVFQLEIWKMATMTKTDYSFQGRTFTEEYEFNPNDFIKYMKKKLIEKEIFKEKDLNNI